MWIFENYVTCFFFFFVQEISHSLCWLWFAMNNQTSMIPHVNFHCAPWRQNKIILIKKKKIYLFVFTPNIFFISFFTILNIQILYSIFLNRNATFYSNISYFYFKFFCKNFSMFHDSWFDIVMIFRKEKAITRKHRNY